MKVDQPILGDGEQQPGYFAQYRFYTAGKVPRGFEEWARRRLSLRRWLLVYLSLEVSIWLVVSMLLIAVSGHLRNLGGVLGIALAGALLIPVSATHYRNKAKRALAPPPSDEVLKRIGEPVPPRP